MGIHFNDFATAIDEWGAQLTEQLRTGLLYHE